jgi:hypothetical protein
MLSEDEDDYDDEYVVCDDNDIDEIYGIVHLFPNFPCCSPTSLTNVEVDSVAPPRRRGPVLEEEGEWWWPTGERESGGM